MGKVRPLREWAIKVGQDCNLACDHCYVYALQDTNWRHKPGVIAKESVAQLAERIAEHAQIHALPQGRHRAGAPACCTSTAAKWPRLCGFCGTTRPL